MDRELKAENSYSTGRAFRKVGRIAAMLAVPYLAALGLMMIFERSLLYPIPDVTLGEWEPRNLVYEDVWLGAADGTRLHGWYLPHQSPRASIVFFHGNGEDVSWCAPEMSHWREELKASVLVMDYRGYGHSEGKPGEKSLVADGILAANWLAKREQIKVSDLVLWGRSIGGGVAAGIAEVIQPRAMVMECTFDSLANVAALHFPWLPVRWLMSNQYPSAKRLTNYSGEFIQWHGDEDDIVPLDSAEKLYNAIRSTHKNFTLGKRLGHNDDSPAEFKTNVRKLFDKLATMADE